MKYWVIPEEMAQYDRKAVEMGTPSDVLMERAGSSAAETALRMILPDNGPVIVFAGPGNNGGDGLVLARKLRESSLDVFVVLAAVPGKSLSHDCQANLGRYAQSGGTVLSPKHMNDLPGSAVLVVDALLGTGFRGEITDVLAECIKRARAYDSKVLAIDTPSGINGKTGDTDPLTLHADVTVTFAAPKAGLLFPPGCGFAGSILVSDIGIEIEEMKTRMVPGLADAAAILPFRAPDGNKGTFGRLLLVGGSESMPGAPQLMALGALRSGTGLVTLSVPLSAHQLIAGRIPEVVSSYFLPGDATGICENTGFQAAAVGPGMGNNSATRKVISHILNNWTVPLVMDADALNVIDDPIAELGSYSGDLLITPHPGEMARLMKCDPSNVTSRTSAASKLADKAGITVVLKGRPTIIFHPERGSCTIPAGNSGLAKGGSGDLLTGIISSLMAQGLEPFDAGILGVSVHGLAADMAVENTSERSLTPSDVAGSLGKAFHVLEKGTKSTLLTSGGKWKRDYYD
jgi:ADP-dependent NAD(P)H-hydrate dehydratase / NAD(P)H-hydrate epimerase